MTNPATALHHYAGLNSGNRFHDPSSRIGPSHQFANTCVSQPGIGSPGTARAGPAAVRPNANAAALANIKPTRMGEP